VSDTNEFNESDFTIITENVSSLDDISKTINFNSILFRKESSGGSNGKSTRHLSSTNSFFWGTFFETKVSFSKEHIISKVKIIFLVESVELPDQEF
jgi:hypothetical protein